MNSTGRFLYPNSCLRYTVDNMLSCERDFNWCSALLFHSLYQNTNKMIQTAGMQHSAKIRTNKLMYQIIKAISCFMLVFINNIYCYTQTCFGLSLCIYLHDRATIRWETPDNRCSFSNTIFFRHTSFSAVFYLGVTNVIVLNGVF